MIAVVDPGPLATIQDTGRTGYAALGVPCSGAFDRGALLLANRLVGNEPDDAAIEITLGGAHFQLLAPATVALTGAVCPLGPDWGAAVTLPAGTSIRLGTPDRGLRSYLAIRGGISVPPVLASRSTDTLSGIGPTPLRAGDRLPIGRATRPLVGASAAEPGGDQALRLRLGPRDDWFTAAACTALVTTEWRVRPDSDRIGIRLDGPPLERAPHAQGRELPSEPTLPGAIQVPSDGRPILFGPDAPVTGGYPVIAVVTDLDAAAQLRPGDVLRFRSERFR